VGGVIRHDLALLNERRVRLILAAFYQEPYELAGAWLGVSGRGSLRVKAGPSPVGPGQLSTGLLISGGRWDTAIESRAKDGRTHGSGPSCR
jgi:hypothetical protein